jgi:hypothetical protein
MVARMFDEIGDPARVKSLERAISFLDQNRSDWNKVYIATAPPGQSYAGRLVGRARAVGDFMMRTDRDQLIIGRDADIPPTVQNGQHFSFTANGQHPAMQNDLTRGPAV